MDYHGTDGNDDINQKTLGIPDGTNVFGGKGNDKITLTSGNAIGEEGDDTIIVTEPWITAAYWNSPSGVDVNLTTGIAHDGYGGTDTLVGVHSVADSGHDDHLTGSAGNDIFWLGWGSDTVEGAGGVDIVRLYNVKYSDVTITYDVPNQTFTLAKHLPNGDTGIDTLRGIYAVEFTGPNSDNVTITRDMFDRSGGFLRDRTSLQSPNMDLVQQMRAGDFNGDGKLDIVVSRASYDYGLTAQPLQILIGDGAGHFSDQTAQLFKDGIPYVHFVPRIFAADFNNDGRTDIFNPDFGVDAPPFPGGQNSLFLSNRSTGLISNETATLPQALRQNHGTSIGDINHDGYLDLLVNALNEGTGNATQLLVNDGTGHFKVSQLLLPAWLTRPSFSAGNTWSMMKDLNNDGYADIVLGAWDANGAASQVLLNDGHGSFAAAQPIDLPRSGVDREIVVGIETIDLNGDALPDLVLSVTNGGDHGEFYKVPYLQLLVNDGSGKFHDETQARLPQSLVQLPGASAEWYLSATPVDMNGDGFQDIVTDGSSGGPAKVFLNDGHGKFSLYWQSAPGTKVVVADVDSDGVPDLVTSTPNGGFSVLYNVLPRTIGASHEYHAGAHGDVVKGTGANETVYSGQGDDQIDAGAGLDTVVYSGALSDYTLMRGPSSFQVMGKGYVPNTDTLTGVERLQFADATVAIDINGTAGQAYRMFQAAFNRAPDAGGLGFHIWAMDQAGVTLTQVAQGFIDSAEFKATYGALNNRDFVTQLYANVLHRAPDGAGLDWHVGMLDSGAITRADDLVVFSESPENQAALIGAMQNGFVFVPFH